MVWTTLVRNTFFFISHLYGWYLNLFDRPECPDSRDSAARSSTPPLPTPVGTIPTRTTWTASSWLADEGSMHSHIGLFCHRYYIIFFPENYFTPPPQAKLVKTSNDIPGKFKPKRADEMMSDDDDDDKDSEYGEGILILRHVCILAFSCAHYRC